MTLMVRIMSLLPFATGSLCLLLVLVSFFGFASGEIEDEIPALPCVGPQEECATGMSESDLCLLYTSPSPRDGLLSRMPSSA